MTLLQTRQRRQVWKGAAERIALNGKHNELCQHRQFCGHFAGELVVARTHRLKFGEQSQTSRPSAGQPVAINHQMDQIGELANLRRNGATQQVAVRLVRRQTAQCTNRRRYSTAEITVGIHKSDNNGKLSSWEEAESHRTTYMRVTKPSLSQRLRWL